jgi:hypothetical protein
MHQSYQRPPRGSPAWSHDRNQRASPNPTFLLPSPPRGRRVGDEGQSNANVDALRSAGANPSPPAPLSVLKVRRGRKRGEGFRVGACDRCLLIIAQMRKQPGESELKIAMFATAQPEGLRPTASIMGCLRHPQDNSRDAQASGWKRTEQCDVCHSSTRQLALLGSHCVEPATAAASFKESG